MPRAPAILEGRGAADPAVQRTEGFEEGCVGSGGGAAAAASPASVVANPSVSSVSAVSAMAALSTDDPCAAVFAAVAFAPRVLAAPAEAGASSSGGLSTGFSETFFTTARELDVGMRVLCMLDILTCGLLSSLNKTHFQYSKLPAKYSEKATAGVNHWLS